MTEPTNLLTKPRRTWLPMAMWSAGLLFLLALIGTATFLVKRSWSDIGVRS